MPPEVYQYFGIDERRLGALILGAKEPKVIAGALELALSTVHMRICKMCEKVQVTNRYELLKWILQHPSCLWPGVAIEPGLHIPPCHCGSFGCLGEIAATMPLAPDLPPDLTELLSLLPEAA
jgi:hypothetical protein